MPTDLIKAIVDVKNIWTLSAFTVAAIVVIVSFAVPKPKAAQKPLFAFAALLAVVGLVPIILSTWLEHSRGRITSIYRVRVTAVDESGSPIEGAVVKSSLPGQTSTASDGAGELAIPAGSMPSDGKLTLWVIKDSSFLLGRADLTLDTDYNPSVTVTMHRDTSAEVRGTVEDQKGGAIPGASISIAGYGGESATSDASGSFHLPAHSSRGQIVRIHVEKKGYQGLDQEHPAGDEPAILVLYPDGRRRGPPVERKRPAPAPATSTSAVNICPNGICISGGTVTNPTVTNTTGLAKPDIQLAPITKNQPDGRGQYKTEVRMTIISDVPIPSLGLRLGGPIISMRAIPQRVGMAEEGPSGVRDGYAFRTLINAYGDYILIVLSSVPLEEFHLTYDPQGLGRRQ